MLCRTHNTIWKLLTSQRKAEKSVPRVVFFSIDKRDLGMFGVVSAGRNYKKPL